MDQNLLKERAALVGKLSQEVGNFILKEATNFDRSVVVLKGKNDLVSYVDREAEKKLVSGLKSIMPEAAFITEEKTEDQLEAEYKWIIDPLDGTTNFVHGLPVFAVSIALAKNGEVILGVVYEVNRQEEFKAWQGGGAYLNGEKIQVSAANTLKDGLFATGFPIYNFKRLEHYLAILRELMNQSHGIRRVGSAAVDLAYVACGRYEGYFEYNLNAWDVAAGSLLVKEAGGTVTDFSGGENYVFGKEIVAAGPVHDQFLSIIKGNWS